MKVRPPPSLWRSAGEDLKKKMKRGRKRSSRKTQADWQSWTTNWCFFSTTLCGQEATKYQRKLLPLCWPHFHRELQPGVSKVRSGARLTSPAYGPFCSRKEKGPLKSLCHWQPPSALCEPLLWKSWARGKSLLCRLEICGRGEGQPRLRHWQVEKQCCNECGTK